MLCFMSAVEISPPVGATTFIAPSWSTSLFPNSRFGNTKVVEGD